MTNLWIISGLLLCILISGTCAYPSPLQEDEDEVESDEEDAENVRKVVTNSFGNGGNLTDAELAEKASKFLAQYISKGGVTGAGGIPLLQVPNHHNRTIIIALVDGKNGTQPQLQQNLNPTHTPFLSPDAYPFLFPTVPSAPETIGDLVFRRQSATAASPQRVNPTLPPFYLAATSPPIYAIPTPQSLQSIPTQPPLPPVSETDIGVDNIEDAILEALLVAQEASTLPPTINQAQLQQIQQLQLPTGLLNLNLNPLYNYNLSALGLLQNNQSFLSPNLGLQAFLLNPYYPPGEATTIPPGANPQLHAIAGLFGSLAQGNLAGVVQSSLKLAGTGVLHNIANSVNCQLFRHCDSRLPVYKF